MSVSETKTRIRWRWPAVFVGAALILSACQAGPSPTQTASRFPDPPHPATATPYSPTKTKVPTAAPERPPPTTTPTPETTRETQAPGVSVRNIQEGELPYDARFLDQLEGFRACENQPEEDWNASLLLYDLSRSRPLAAHNIDQQMPVASAFKGPVLFYALSQLDSDILQGVPVEYWSQKGDIPDEYLSHLRKHWILSRLYNMIVHSSNQAAAQVLDYIHDQNTTGANPLEQFNAWSRAVIHTSPDAGLYQWQYPPLEGLVDPSSPPQQVQGRCGSSYTYFNTYSVRDLGLYYEWLVDQAPAHVREIAFQLLSIVEEEPGYVETTAVRLRGRSVSKAGYYGGKGRSYVWVDAGLILLEDDYTYLVTTATINSSHLLPILYEEIERIIEEENGLPHTHLINQLQIPAWAARLKDVAASYQANTSEAAGKIAQEIDFIEGENVEGSSTMCGPLSAAMLRDAGLLEGDVNLETFWLPDPLRNGRPWSLFDLEEYDLFGFRSPQFSLHRFDFNQFPLLPGDLLYTHGGSGTHVFVVTEVDDQGRAYTVTNYCLDRHDCPIQRLMLYDPQKPGTGAFYEEFQTGWFRTGQGGFDLLRTREYPQVYPDWYDTFLLNDE